MNLVERYIEAVKFWLPEHIRKDVVAELADDIRSEIEEAEREKRRTLTEDEIAAILKARGRPMLVASRFLPKRWLIGPELFPMYILVLKIVAFASFIPVTIVVLAALAAHQNADIIATTAWDQFWNTIKSAFVVVTIVFAVIEIKGMPSVAADNWNPKSLRPVVDQSRIPRATSIGDIVGNLILMALFAAGYLSQSEYSSPLGSVTLSPVWVPFCQISVAIGVAEVALSAANLFKPYWSLPRILARAAVDFAKTAAFTWLISTNMVREVSLAAMPHPPTDSILSASITVMQHAIEVAAVCAIIIVAHAIWRIYHLRPARTALPA